tara:strand:- start:2765 stop:3265 length:501 start_codon:yes stop_codon:yes gene_type:complete
MKDETYYFHQTPSGLAKKLIELIPLVDNDIVLEPFRGEGNFYNNLPDNVIKEWTEIEEGRDYTTFNNEVDWVISNPPFRLQNNQVRINAFWTILKHFASIVRKGIGFLCNDNCFATLTPKRMKELNNLGIYIHSYKVCSIKAWRGRYFFIIFTRQPSNIGYIEGNF